MRSLAFVLAISIALAPSFALARPGGGGGGGGGRGGGGGGGGRAAQSSRPAPSQGRSAPSRGGSAPSQGRGFNLGNDVPSSRPSGGQNRSNGTRNNPNVGNQNRNPNVGNGTKNNPNVGNKSRNPNVGNGTKNNGNRTNNNGNNKNNGNRSNTNVKNNGNTYNKNVNVNSTNAYGWHGAVVANPAYGGAAWGWNHGAVWAPVGSYWGGGFWGAFAVGATTAAVMGSVVRNNQTYNSYEVSSGSPGSTLLSNYGLQQVECGGSGLVVIYGPNNGVICAEPNSRVAAGSYAVNADSLTLQSQ